MTYLPPLIHDKPRKYASLSVLEKYIQDDMLYWLRIQPHTFVWRQNSGSMFIDSPTGRHGFRSASVQGISDIIGIYHGIPLAVEVKRPGNKPTEMQRKFLRDFAAAGGYAICCCDVQTLSDRLRKIRADAASGGFTGEYEELVKKESIRTP